MEYHSADLVTRGQVHSGHSANALAIQDDCLRADVESGLRVHNELAKRNQWGELEVLTWFSSPARLPLCRHTDSSRTACRHSFRTRSSRTQRYCS